MTDHATSPEAAAVVRGHEITKRFGEGGAAVDALRGVSVDFARGSFTAIMGPSGSGKSTLMHILAELDSATSGWVEIDGTRLDELNDRELTLLRRREVGFIFQSYNLLPVLNAEQNIALPLRIGGADPDREWLDTLIRTVDLDDRRTRRPPERGGPHPAPHTGPPRPPPPPPPRRALRRPAAARGGGPGARDPARRRVRRRADRQPRLQRQPRRARPAAPRGRRVRPDDRD